MYTVATRHTLVYTVATRHILVYTVATSHTLLYTVATSHTLVYTVSTRHTLVYTVATRHTLVYNVATSHTLVYTVATSHTLVYTVATRHTLVYTVATRHTLDMSANVDAFDTSEYPTTHPLHSKRNAKTLGKFKDECNSLQPHEFIGLRSKMYSQKLSNGRIKNTTKWVSRSHILKNLKHKDYLHTLQTTTSFYTTFRTITSQKHAVKTQEVNKRCLTAFDDKRYILPDGVATLAHAHFRIAELNAEAKGGEQLIYS